VFSRLAGAVSLPLSSLRGKRENQVKHTPSQYCNLAPGCLVSHTLSAFVGIPRGCRGDCGVLASMNTIPQRLLIFLALMFPTHLQIAGCNNVEADN
jgi:hypothetical protein